MHVYISFADIVTPKNSHKIGRPAKKSQPIKRFAVLSVFVYASLTNCKGAFCMLKIIVIGMSIFAMVFGFPNVHSSESISKSDLSDGFQLSDSEKKGVEEFLQSIKTSGTFEFNKVLNAALDGNEIAMYITGQCSLMGTGTSINRKAANQQFKMAASLGYPPALFEIFQMYANENQDPLLALVYLNLTISSGHKEYRNFYFKQTDLLSKIAGKSVVDEIEKISLQKTIQLSEIQKEFQQRKNTYKPAIKLLSKNITSEDRFYDEKYWKQFFVSEEAYNQFFGKNEPVTSNE